MKTVIQNAPVAMATLTGPEHVFDLLNDRFLEMFQRGHEIRGRALREEFPESTEDGRIVPIFDEVYRTGTPFAASEFPVTVRIGDRVERRIYSFTIVPTRDAGGTVYGLMAAAVDVTEVVRAREVVEDERDRAESARRAAETARDRSEFLLRSAIALGEGLDVDAALQRFVETIVPSRADFASVWTRDARGGLRRRANAPAGSVATQKATDPVLEVAPTIPLDSIFEGGPTQVLDDVLATMRALGARPDEMRIVEDAGLRRAALVPVRRGDRTTLAVLTVANVAERPLDPVDVTLFEATAGQAALALENARLFHEAEQLRRSAEEATLAKDEFLAHVSHDLRNPLGTILGWAALLKGAPKDAAQVAKGVEIIERNAKVQVQLIEDLLDVSRIAAGKFHVEPSPVDVERAIDDALEPARIAAHARGLVLETDVDDDVGSIVVDPDRFRQVVWNLASNAVKFTRKGTIRVRVRRDASRLRVVVSDTGVGIAAEFLPHVWGKFEQADKGVTRGGGLGLGLAIVRHIVELHGGTVAVESAGEGLGSTFTVLFPIRASHRPSSAEGLAEPGGWRYRLEGVSILVVDDEDDARDVLSAILEASGANVVAVGSVDLALEFLSSGRVDAIVSDVSMPEKSGYDFARAVRDRDAGDGGRVPMIALTALARSANRIDALNAGFDAHVAKPVEPEELVLVIEGLLRPLGLGRR